MFPCSVFQRLGRGILSVLIFVIPFSNAGIEILFFPLLVLWLIGWHMPSDRTASVWEIPSLRGVLTWLLAYVAVCVWSVSLSDYPMLSLTGLVAKTLEYILFFVVVSDVANTPERARRGLFLLYSSVVLIVLYGFLQEWRIHHFTGAGVPHDFFIPRIKLSYGRMVGPYFNPNDLATFLMVCALIFLAHLLEQPVRSHRMRWFFLVVVAACVVWTRSKGSILGFCIGSFLLFFISSRRQKIWLKVGIGILLVVGFFLFKEKGLWTQLSFSDPSSQERSVMWKAACGMIRDHPFFGLGLNTFMAHYLHYAVGPNQGPAYAHNCFLQIGAETGFLGLLVFIGFLMNLIFFLWNSLKMEPSQDTLLVRSWCAGLTAALIGFLVQSVFDTNFYALRQATLFWTFAGLAVGAGVQLRQAVA